MGLTRQLFRAARLSNMIGHTGRGTLPKHLIRKQIFKGAAKTGIFRFPK
jgi:hypothetical protein